MNLQIWQFKSLQGFLVYCVNNSGLDNNVEKKALSILSSFKNLSKYYTDDMIEEGCQILLEISQAPSLSVLKTILKRMKEKTKEKEAVQANAFNSDYGFVRGAKYFGGGTDEK